MKTCIWCKFDENEKSFNNIAHIIPQSLGANLINERICDECNSYFGNKKSGEPTCIEEVIKEAFNITITRIRQSRGFSDLKPKRFKSVFFDIKLKNEKWQLKIKPRFKFKNGFQNSLGRYFRRGIYKLLLEELDRQNSDGRKSNFDFVREFARFDIGDYPVIYFRRKVEMFLISKRIIESPELFIDKKYEDLGFIEINFLEHIFGVPKIRRYDICFDDYIRKSNQAKAYAFHPGRPVKYLADVDILLNVLDGNS